MQYQKHFLLVGDKVFHCVIGEKLLKFAVKLRRQGLVVGDDKRRLVQRLDDVGHCKRLARSRDAQKRLKLISFFKALHQLGDSLGLIAGGGVF